MNKAGLSGIIYGIILLIIGALGVYSLDYLNNIYTAYFILILGICGIIGGSYFHWKS